MIWDFLRLRYIRYVIWPAAAQPPLVEITIYNLHYDIPRRRRSRRAKEKPRLERAAKRAVLGARRVVHYHQQLESNPLRPIEYQNSGQVRVRHSSVPSQSSWQHNIDFWTVYNIFLQIKIYFRRLQYISRLRYIFYVTIYFLGRAHITIYSLRYSPKPNINLWIPP